MKRQLTVYGTSRPRGVNKNAMALLGQSRDSWPSMAPLGHVELTKMQKLLESKNKNQNENEKQIENKNENSFLFSFSFLFSVSLLFLFLNFVFAFIFAFVFIFNLLLFLFLFLFSFLFLFYFLVFSFKFYYGTSRPPCWCKQMKMIRSSQPAIPFTELIETQLFSVSIVKTLGT